MWESGGVMFRWLGLGIAAALAVAAPAMALHAVDPSGGGTAAFSRVLTPEDADRYSRIFDYQRRGKWGDADREIRALDNKLLLGHVLRERYLHPNGYRATFRELADWLKDYADHPSAELIYRMAVKRQPNGVAAPRQPSGVKMGPPGAPMESASPTIAQDAAPASSVAEPVAPPAGQEAAADEAAVASDATEVDDNEADEDVVATADPTAAEPEQAPTLGPASQPVPRSRTAEEARTISRIESVMRRELKQKHPEMAHRQLDRPEMAKLLSGSEYDEWRRRVASAYFFLGEDRKALDLASAAAERSRDLVPSADWIAGLTSWRLGLLDGAAHHFGKLAYAAGAQASDRAAGAFWAARAFTKLGQPQAVNSLLAIAAEYQRTFYGQLAARQLGRDAPFDFRQPPLGAADERRLAAIPAVRRALALHEAGESLFAEKELRRLSSAAQGRLGAAMIGLADRLQTPAAALSLAKEWYEVNGETLDAALYPLPPWTPKNGFSIERAVVFGFMRQESGFNARARSPVGAAGLLQLMPRTASFISRDASLARAHGREKLYQPEFNMDLGQRYMRHLFETPVVQANLVFMAAAYNGGPGNLGRWLRDMKFDDDVFVFIEAIPSGETRNFVQKVISNIWTYRARFGEPQFELDAVASGNWPRFSGRVNGPAAEAPPTPKAAAEAPPLRKPAAEKSTVEKTADRGAD
jgi:soluble lytic murein transglycosylase